jgi:hypothetical protein
MLGKSPLLLSNYDDYVKEHDFMQQTKPKNYRGKHMKEEKKGLFVAAPLDGMSRNIAGSTIQHNQLFGGVHV